MSKRWWVGALAAGCGALLNAGIAQASLRTITGTFSGTLYGTDPEMATWNGTATFSSRDGQYFSVVSGSITYSVSGTQSSQDNQLVCTFAGGGTLSLGPRSPGAIFLDLQHTPHEYSGYLSQLGAPFTKTCTFFGTVTEDLGTDATGSPTWWSQAADSPVTGRNKLVGSYTWGDADTGGSNTWNFTLQSCPSDNTRTGKGYATLTPAMKSALSRLYDTLEAGGACYHFTVGSRDLSAQQDLYTRWHDITDRSHSSGESDREVCQQLATGYLAQLPKGLNGSTHDCAHVSGTIQYNRDGTAKGGPAKPGRSRHEHHEAADITVLFPPTFTPDVPAYRAAAAAAGLCGPPATDPIHVELPYIRPPETTPRCHFK